MLPLLGAGLVGLLLTAIAAPSHGAPPSTADAARARSRESCLMCHGDSSLTRSDGRGGSLAVESSTLDNSAHASLACTDCHRDAAGSMHDSHLAQVRCGSCHAAAADSLVASVHAGLGNVRGAACKTCHGTHAIARTGTLGLRLCESCHAHEVGQYRSSVHGVALAAGDTEASKCSDCHGLAHRMRTNTDPQSPVSHARLAATCARCHADRALMIRRRITIPEAVELYRNSAHGRSARADAATCNNCHESHDLKRATDPTSSVNRANIPATCGACHSRIAAAYRESVHGTALARGVTAAPVCTDCHGEHRISGPNDLTSPVAANHITETCARCHDAIGIRETFGLPAGRLSTYRESFHGLAARGGSPAVANCASCHGFHDILPSSDVRSRVSPARLAETCGRCHPGAGSKFRMGPVHVAMATPAQPVLYWTRRVYLLLIFLTIGFMLLHNGLDYGRKIAASLAVHAGRAAPHARQLGQAFERMSLGERIQHVLLAVSFFTLVFTGFALKFPEAWPFAWLARLEGGYAWRSNIHRVAAVVMVGVSLFHVGYLLTPRGRALLAGLLPSPRDATEMLQNTLHLFGLRAQPPRFGRFGYIEKAEYWALIWGTLMMTVTGLLLWFENQAMSVLPKWTLDLATIVHYYEAWLAFLAIVVWHLYQNVLNPDIYPMNWTWLTGRIPGWQMRHEHPREYERLMALEAAAAAARVDHRPGAAPDDAAPGTVPPSTPGTEPPPRPEHTA